MLDTLYFKLSFKVEMYCVICQRCTGGAEPDSATRIDRAVIAAIVMRCTQIVTLGLDFNEAVSH